MSMFSVEVEDVYFSSTGSVIAGDDLMTWYIFTFELVDWSGSLRNAFLFFFFFPLMPLEVYICLLRYYCGSQIWNHPNSACVDFFMAWE